MYQKSDFNPGSVVHAFNPSIQEAEIGFVVSSKPAWAIYEDPVSKSPFLPLFPSVSFSGLHQQTSHKEERGGWASSAAAVWPTVHEQCCKSWAWWRTPSTLLLRRRRQAGSTLKASLVNTSSSRTPRAEEIVSKQKANKQQEQCNISVSLWVWGDNNETTDTN